MTFRKKLVELLAAVPPHHPVFLFLQLFSVHFVNELPFALPLMVLALTGTLITRKNYFWYVGIAVTPGLGSIGLINIFFGLLSLDEVWKLPLFLYLIGDLYLRSIEAAWMFYNFLALLALLVWIYRQLPFNTPSDNGLYFGGFGGLWFMHLTIFLSNTLDIATDRWYFAILLTCCSMGCSFYVILRRMQQIFNMKLNEIESASQYMMYVRHVEEQLQEPFEQVGIQKAHRQHCRQVDCGCRESNRKVSFDRLFIREHYNWAKLKFGMGRATNFLEEYLIRTLVDEDQFPLAVEQYLMVKCNPHHDFFSMIQVRRLETILEVELAKVEQVYIIKQKFENAFDYQVNFQVLKRDIRELVDLKLQFWQEVCRPYSKLTVLRKLGPDILQRFNAMNNFYHSTIKPIEEEIHLFSGSIIFNLFLLMATNYKQLAQSSIKLLRKSSDVPAIDHRKDTKSFYIKVSLSKQTFAIIENSTVNFLKLIRTNFAKGEFIGKSMEFLIPTCYREEHLRGMRELRRYNINNLLGVDVNPIFFLDSCDRIVPCNVVVKYSVSILNELSVIANVKKLNDDADYILFDKDQSPSYISDERIDMRLIDQPDIVNALQNIRGQWKNVLQVQQVYQPVAAIKLAISIDQVSYTCVLSSPLSTSFRYPHPPPIHLSIHNQSQTYFADTQLNDDLEVGDCMKKVNQFIEINDDESKSTGGNSSYETIDVIKKVEGATVPPIMGKFAAAMHAVVLFGLLGSVLCFVLFNGSWSGDPTPEQLSYKMIGSTYRLQNFIARSTSKGLTLYAIDSQLMTDSYYSQGYATKNYTEDSLKMLGSICSSLKSIVTIDMRFQDNYMPQDYYTLSGQPIEIITSRATHYLSLMDILANSASDCIEISNGNKFNETTIPLFYWKYITDNTHKLISVVKGDLDKGLNEMNKFNIILTVLLVAVVMLCVVPVEIGNRTISNRQNSVYELIVSTETEQVMNDINTLLELDSSLRNNSSSYRTLPSQNELIPANNNMNSKCKDNSELQEDNSGQRRKRNGQIDYTGYRRSAGLLYVSLALASLAIIGQFAVKYQNVESVRQNIQHQISGYEWRNGRIMLLVNLKKFVFNFNRTEQISGLSLEDWIQQAISDRKVNYVLRNSLTNFSYDCTNPLLCSPNSSLSSELAMSQYGETLTAELFLQQNILKLGLLERIEEICNDLFEKDQANIEDEFVSSLRLYTILKTMLLVVGIVVAGLGIIFNILFVRMLKKEFIVTIRMVTLLNEEMVRKNKRVESFLQRLSKKENDM